MRTAAAADAAATAAAATTASTGPLLLPSVGAVASWLTCLCGVVDTTAAMEDVVLLTAVKNSRATNAENEQTNKLEHSTFGWDGSV